MKRRLNPKSSRSLYIVGKYLFSNNSDWIVGVSWISLVLILLIEFWFKSIPARDFLFISRNVFIKFGILIPNICYSIVSAFIFYLIVVYLPLERKTVKGAMFLENRTYRIAKEIEFIIYALHRTSGGSFEGKNKFLLTFEEVSKITANINRLDPVRGESTETGNWVFYLLDKTNQINRNIPRYPKKNKGEEKNLPKGIILSYQA